jgi:hypothetical protein
VEATKKRPIRMIYHLLHSKYVFPAEMDGIKKGAAV